MRVDTFWSPKCFNNKPDMMFRLDRYCTISSQRSSQSLALGSGGTIDVPEELDGNCWNSISVQGADGSLATADL